MKKIFLITRLREEGDSEYKASEIILQTKNVRRLTEIINIIARIPEIKIEMLGQGNWDPESITKLLLGWVNGDKVKNIAKNIKRAGQSDEEVISLCNRYLNSQMKSYMPWGMNIYQAVSYDLQTENAQMLPFNFSICSTLIGTSECSNAPFLYLLWCVR